MQKITRKSSSGKFALPTFKREKSRLHPDAGATPTSSPYIGGTPSEVDDGEEELGGSVSSLRDAGSGGVPARESKDLGRSSTRSWSSAFKIGKGKGKVEREGQGEETAEESEGES